GTEERIPRSAICKFVLPDCDDRGPALWPFPSHTFFTEHLPRSDTRNPDPRMIPVGKDQEVVVKIDLESETGRRPNRLPLNLAVVIDHSGSMAGAKIEKTK